MSLVQAASDPSAGLNDPFTYLTGLGFPGMIIALLLTGQLRTKGEVERMIEENKRKDGIIDLKDKQIEALQTGIVDKAIPALTRSTQVLEALPQSEATILEQIRSAQRDVARLTQRLDDPPRSTGRE